MAPHPAVGGPRYCREGSQGASKWQALGGRHLPELPSAEAGALHLMLVPRSNVPNLHLPARSCRARILPKAGWHHLGPSRTTGTSCTHTPPAKHPEGDGWTPGHSVILHCTGQEDLQGSCTQALRNHRGGAGGVGRMQEVKRVFVLLSGFLLSKIGPKLSTGCQGHIFPYHAHFPVTCQSTQSLPCPDSCQRPQGTFTFLCPLPSPSLSFLLRPPPPEKKEPGGRNFH